jgi:hypothetical protein
MMAPVVAADLDRLIAQLEAALQAERAERPSGSRHGEFLEGRIATLKLERAELTTKAEGLPTGGTT